MLLLSLLVTKISSTVPVHQFSDVSKEISQIFNKVCKLPKLDDTAVYRSLLLAPMETPSLPNRMR